jgi:hypothetical protein
MVVEDLELEQLAREMFSLSTEALRRQLADRAETEPRALRAELVDDLQKELPSVLLAGRWLLAAAEVPLTRREELVDELLVRLAGYLINLARLYGRGELVYGEPPAPTELPA